MLVASAPGSVSVCVIPFGTDKHNDRRGCLCSAAEFQKGLSAVCLSALV